MKVTLQRLLVTDIELELPEVCACGQDLREEGMLREDQYIGSDQQGQLGRDGPEVEGGFDNGYEVAFVVGYTCETCGVPLVTGQLGHLENEAGNRLLEAAEHFVETGPFDTSVLEAAARGWAVSRSGWTEAHLCSTSPGCLHVSCERCGEEDLRPPGAPMPTHRCPPPPGAPPTELAGG